MNHPKAVKATQSETGNTLVASTPQGSTSKSNEQLTRKVDRSASENEGLLANTARAIGSMVGKFVAKRRGGMSTTAKKAVHKAAAGQGSTKKAPRRSGRRAVRRDSNGQFRKSDDAGRSLGTEGLNKKGRSMPNQKKSSNSGKSRAKGRSKVGKVMGEYKRGSLKSSSGRKVKSRKQAVAIALSEARSGGAKIPPKKKTS
jgi:hypothetical protein